MQTKLAVVILNWNGSAMLRRFLPSVLAYSDAEGVKVIVVDNSSTDDSLAVLEREFPTVERLVLDCNYGFAGGYNKALRQVEAEYYLLLNSDVEVTQGWLLPLLAYMDAHPEVAACQPKLLDYKEKEATGKDVFEYAGACGGYLDRYGYPFCRGRVMSAVEADSGQYDTVRSVFWATGAALLVRGCDYWAVGGFDDRFFAHMEEIDLCWRLRSRGRGIVCIPQSRVYHVGGATLNKENPRKTYLNFRNNLLMLYKNLSEDRLKPVMRARRLLDYVAALTFCLKGEWDNARAVCRARKDFREMCPGVLKDRLENLEETVCSPVPEQYAGSQLWKYYFGGCRRFDGEAFLK